MTVLQETIDGTYLPMMHSKHIKLVIGPVVLAKIPRRRQDLKYFLGRAEEEASIVSMLLGLSCIISTAKAGDFIHVSHLCFTEFICDPHGLTDATKVLSFIEMLITGRGKYFVLWKNPRAPSPYCVYISGYTTISRGSVGRPPFYHAPYVKIQYSARITPFLFPYFNGFSAESRLVTNHEASPHLRLGVTRASRRTLSRKPPHPVRRQPSGRVLQTGCPSTG